MTLPPTVEQWAARGSFRPLGPDGEEVFVLDLPGPDTTREPVLLLHGFPTSSYDWHHVVDPVAATRRVIALDFLGFGLSAKPDRRYGIELHADVAEAVLADLGVARFALATHDMGDSVGGELLARALEGTSPLEITRRVLTNGSIYLDLAQLTPGQHLLLSLADERSDLGLDDPGTALQASLAATCAPALVPDGEELEAHWQLIASADGHTLLARTIRYLEDRRAREDRYTGAIESHPSPLTVVWGEQDPIAVAAMADRLAAAAPSAAVVRLDGVGHYPMLEDPARLTAAVLSGLEGP